MPIVNKAAYLESAGQALVVREAPMPTPGPNEVIVQNHAVAINPLDWHMTEHGVFVKEWPAIVGCDVAGIVHAVGEGVTRFKAGDRVVGHAIGLVSGRAQDGAFAHYTTLSVDKVAILPDSIDFTHGVVVPFALEAAICALCVQEPQTFMPGVFTPALGLPVPALSRDAKLGKTLVVNGASASTGAMVVQVARAIGLDVIAIAGAANTALVKQAGAQVVLDRAAPDLVDQVVEAVKATSGEFIGIFDAVSEATTLPTDLAILDRLGGGHLALTHPPPKGIPQNVQVGMIFAVDDIAAPVWRDFVTPALASCQLQCLPPPLVVGKGLDFVQRGLEMSRAGVSGRKLVIELDW